MLQQQNAALSRTMAVTYLFQFYTKIINESVP